MDRGHHGFDLGSVEDLVDLLGDTVCCGVLGEDIKSGVLCRDGVLGEARATSGVELLELADQILCLWLAEYVVELDASVCCGWAVCDVADLLELLPGQSLHGD